MGMGQFFADAFRQSARKYEIIRFLPEQSDKIIDPAPFREGESYCRLWLVEMALEKGVDWFKKRYPVAHSAAAFNFGGGVVTVPFIAEPGFLKAKDRNNLDRVIQLNYALTPLFPFSHGLVELQAGLFSMAAADWVNKFVKTLSRFSKLISVPELSAVLHLTEPVYSGIEDLIGSGDGALELGCHLAFSQGQGGGNTLTPGYFAVFLAEHRDLAPFVFKIVQNRLLAAEKTASPPAADQFKPFTGFSYMLFEIEKRDHQQWEALTSIKELVDKALEALTANNKEAAQSLAAAIDLTIMRSPDITRADRRRLLRAIKAVLQESLLQGSPTSLAALSLYSIMNRPLPPPNPDIEAEIEALEKFW